MSSMMLLFDSLEKSGVYKLTCDTCEGVYLGKNGRQLKTRIKEHILSWNTKYKISRSADHLIDNNYKFTNYSVKLIHTCKKGTISETIGKQLNKLNIKTSYKAYKNLKKIISTPKDKPDKLEKSGVYKLICDTCEGIYVGQTGRQLKPRIKEHIHSWNTIDKKSNFADHLIDNNHSFTNNSVKLIHTCSKGIKK